MPFGIALAMLVRPARAYVAGSILSFAIEVAQLWVPGRHTSAGDVLFNTTGTILGVALLAGLPWLLRPSRRAALSLSAAWAVVVAALLLGGVWLLQPVYPPTSYYGQWTPKLNTFAHYEGRVLDARVGDIALPAWRLDDSRAAAAALRSGEPLAVLALAGPPPRTVAPIFSIADGERRQILMLAADGTDLVYRFRTRAQELRLDSPDLRIHAGLSAHAPGDTLRLALGRADGGRTVALRLNDRVERLELGVRDTWGLLLSVDSINREPTLRRVIGFAWIAALLGPLAFWLAAAAAAPRTRG